MYTFYQAKRETGYRPSLSHMFEKYLRTDNVICD